MKVIYKTKKVFIELHIKNGSILSEELTVPDDTKYLAIDKRGDLYAYKNMPYKSAGAWDSYSDDHELIAEIGLNFKNWEDCLWTVQSTEDTKLLIINM